MAYSNINGLNGMMEELRYPGMRSPEAEAPFSAGLNSNRDSNPFFSALPNTNNDVRGTLQRRFTTDSSKLPLNRNSGSQYTSYSNSTVSTPSVYESFSFVSSERIYRLSCCVPLLLPSNAVVGQSSDNCEKP